MGGRITESWDAKQSGQMPIGSHRIIILIYFHQHWISSLPRHEGQRSPQDARFDELDLRIRGSPV